MRANIVSIRKLWIYRKSRLGRCKINVVSPKCPKKPGNCKINNERFSYGYLIETYVNC